MNVIYQDEEENAYQFTSKLQQPLLAFDVNERQKDVQVKKNCDSIQMDFPENCVRRKTNSAQSGYDSKICGDNEHLLNSNDSEDLDRDEFETESEERIEKMHWKMNFTSNLFFLIGSCLYLAVATMEWKFPSTFDDNYSHSDDSNDLSQAGQVSSNRLMRSGDRSNDFDHYGSHHGFHKKHIHQMHQEMSLLGAIFFLLNSLTDATSSIILLNSYYDFSKENFKCKHLFGLYAALTFGSGAFLDLWYYDYAGNWPDVASGFLNISSAFFSIIYTIQSIHSSNTKKSLSKKVICLVLTGEILFLIGSLIDTALSLLNVYYDYSQNKYLKKMILELNILSSILWLIDSLFYLFSDWSDKRNRVRCKQCNNTHRD